MKILSVSGSHYEDNDGEVLNLHVRLDENEIIAVGQMIGIEMMDDSIHETEVKIIEPRYAGDYQAVSRKIAAKVASGEYGTSKKQKKQIKGPCVTDLVVMNVPYHEVKTDEEINARKMIAEMRKKVCVSPFKEIRCGKESIYDYVKDGYTVPDKVIAYLRTTEPYLMSPVSTGTVLVDTYHFTSYAELISCMAGDYVPGQPRPAGEYLHVVVRLGNGSCCCVLFSLLLNHRGI